MKKCRNQISKQIKITLKWKKSQCKLKRPPGVKSLRFGVKYKQWKKNVPTLLEAAERYLAREKLGSANRNYEQNKSYENIPLTFTLGAFHFTDSQEQSSKNTSGFGSSFENFQSNALSDNSFRSTENAAQPRHSQGASCEQQPEMFYGPQSQSEPIPRNEEWLEKIASEAFSRFSPPDSTNEISSRILDGIDGNYIDFPHLIHVNSQEASLQTFSYGLEASHSSGFVSDNLVSHNGASDEKTHCDVANENICQDNLENHSRIPNEATAKTVLEMEHDILTQKATEDSVIQNLPHSTSSNDSYLLATTVKEQKKSQRSNNLDLTHFNCNSFREQASESINQEFIDTERVYDFSATNSAGSSSKELHAGEAILNHSYSSTPSLFLNEEIGSLNSLLVKLLSTESHTENTEEQYLEPDLKDTVFNNIDLCSPHNSLSNTGRQNNEAYPEESFHISTLLCEVDDSLLAETQPHQTESQLQRTETSSQQKEIPPQQTETPYQQTDTLSKHTETSSQHKETPFQQILPHFQHYETPYQHTVPQFQHTDTPSQHTETQSKHTEAQSRHIETPSPHQEIPPRQTKMPFQDTESQLKHTQITSRCTEIPPQQTEIRPQQTEMCANTDKGEQRTVQTKHFFSGEDIHSRVQIPTRQRHGSSDTMHNQQPGDNLCNSGTRQCSGAEFKWCSPHHTKQLECTSVKHVCSTEFGQRPNPSRDNQSSSEETMRKEITTEEPVPDTATSHVSTAASPLQEEDSLLPNSQDEIFQVDDIQEVSTISSSESTSSIASDQEAAEQQAEGGREQILENEVQQINNAHLNTIGLNIRNEPEEQDELNQDVVIHPGGTVVRWENDDRLYDIQLGAQLQANVFHDIQVGAQLQDNVFHDIQVGAQLQDNVFHDIQVGAQLQDDVLQDIHLGDEMQDLWPPRPISTDIDFHRTGDFNFDQERDIDRRSESRRRDEQRSRTSRP